MWHFNTTRGSSGFRSSLYTHRFFCCFFFLKLRVLLEIPEKCHISKCYFNELSGNDVSVETDIILNSNNLSIGITITN